MEVILRQCLDFRWIAVNSQLIEEEWKLVAEEDEQKQDNEHYEYSKHDNPAFTIGKETDSFDIEDGEFGRGKGMN